MSINLAPNGGKTHSTKAEFGCERLLRTRQTLQISRRACGEWPTRVVKEIITMQTRQFVPTRTDVEENSNDALSNWKWLPSDEELSNYAGRVYQRPSRLACSTIAARL